MSKPDFQPTLSSPAITLRPLQADDWSALYAVASDPLIWSVHPARNLWQEPAFRTLFETTLASRSALVAIDPATGTIIGSSRYYTGRALPGEVEIGWTFLARSHWGGATNAAMKALMIEHALRHFDSVIFLIGESNFRSRRAMENIGGVLTDRAFMAVIAGTAFRHVIYTIDRGNFASGPLFALA